MRVLTNSIIIKLLGAVISAIFISALLTTNLSAAEYTIKSRGPEVSYIQSALKRLGFFHYKEITGYYGDITATAVEEFQKENGLPVTGVTDDATFKLIDEKYNETGASDDKTGALDWYSVVQYAFEKGSSATILDIDTGKSFQVMRTYGHNHADVEPLTKEDTEILREIWGGKDSWERRAVIVSFGDYNIAASMVGYAHAGRDDAAELAVVNNLSGGYGRGQNLDAVKGNNFNGHTCLHFLNSLTHGNNKLDAKHQAAVEKAAKYLNN